jgi:hypothetical protein
VGENFQKFFVQIKEDIKEMLAQEKAESIASSKKDEENVLQLNAEVVLFDRYHYNLLTFFNNPGDAGEN